MFRIYNFENLRNSHFYLQRFVCTAVVFGQQSTVSQQCHDVSSESMCCVFYPAVRCCVHKKLIEILFLVISNHFWWIQMLLNKFSPENTKKMFKKHYFKLHFEAGWHPNTSRLPEGVLDGLSGMLLTQNMQAK